MIYKVYQMMGNFSSLMGEFEEEYEAVDYVTENAMKDVEEEYSDDLSYMTEEDFQMAYENAVSYYGIDMD